MRSAPSATCRRDAGPPDTAQTGVCPPGPPEPPVAPPASDTARLGMRTIGGGATDGDSTLLTATGAWGSWNVTLAVISGLTCASAFRMLTRTLTIDFARSADGKICRRGPRYA